MLGTFLTGLGPSSPAQGGSAAERISSPCLSDETSVRDSSPCLFVHIVFEADQINVLSPPFELEEVQGADVGWVLSGDTCHFGGLCGPIESIGDSTGVPVARFFCGKRGRALRKPSPKAPEASKAR